MIRKQREAGRGFSEKRGTAKVFVDNGLRCVV
jgi:hypothetical protein